MKTKHPPARTAGTTEGGARPTARVVLAIVLIAMLTVPIVATATASVAAAQGDATPTPTPSGNETGTGTATATPTPTEPACGTLSDYDTTAAYQACLVNTTTREQILRIIEQHPDDVTTKQKDRVYAVYPEHADAFGFTSREEQRIRDWMTWDQLGVTPAWATNGTTAGSAGTLLDARDAVLVVKQPHYIDGEVTQSRANGTLVYTASGEALLLRPERFSTAAVVDFGVSPAGTLTYDRDLDVYEFRPPAPGTYTVFWVVQETRVTGDGDGTGGAAGQPRQVTARYAARIRVTGGLNLSHRPRGEFAQMRSDARNWTDLVDLFERTGILDEGETMAGQLEEIIPWAQLRLTEDPLKALTNTYTEIVLIIFIGGVGGYIFLVQVLGLPAWIIKRLREQLHRFERTEAKEGSTRDAIAELDYRERLTAPQTTRVHDLYEDEQIAAAMADAFGTTLGDAAETFLNELRPRLRLARELALLGENGWVGIDTTDSAADTGGGARADGGAANPPGERSPSWPVEIVREDELPPGTGVDDDAVIDLTGVGPDDDLLDRIDPRAPLDVPLEDLPEVPERMGDAPEYDLQTLAGLYDVDMRLFQDPGTYGEYLERHVAFLHEHPVLSDGQDGVDAEAYVLGRYLKLAQFMQDQFDWPAMGYIRRGITHARIQYDTAEETTDLIKQIQRRESPAPNGDANGGPA